MNIDLIKDEIKEKLGKQVKVTVYGMRNRNTTYIGTLHELYPNIFTVLVDGESKSFTYADVITKEVVVKYL